MFSKVAYFLNQVVPNYYLPPVLDRFSDIKSFDFSILFNIYQTIFNLLKLKP